MRTRVNAGYMAQGADDFGTIAANRAGFEKIRPRPQRLVDVSKIDRTTEIFGQKVESKAIAVDATRTVPPRCSDFTNRANVSVIAIDQISNGSNRLDDNNDLGVGSANRKSDASGSHGRAAWFLFREQQRAPQDTVECHGQPMTT